MMLCSVCLSMFDNGRRRGVHHLCIEDVQKAAQGGCKICIHLALTHEKRGSGPENEDTAHPLLQYHWDQPEDPGWDMISFRYTRSGSHLSDIHLHVSDTPETIPDWYSKVSALAAKDRDTEPSTVRRELFPRKDFATSLGHESVLAVAKMWIDRCCQSHNCEVANGTEDPKWYPERLIDLINPTSPRLVRTRLASETPRSRYATLSHCWGPDPNFLTLRIDNLEAFCKRIHLDSIAKSFRDAIAICNHLGIRYVWVDSLCILQDSTEDWLLHAKAMASIYLNCYINLAFDGASCPAIGAIVDRDTYQLQECYAFSGGPHNIVQEDKSSPDASPIAGGHLMSKMRAGAQWIVDRVRGNTTTHDILPSGSRETRRYTVFSPDLDYTFCLQDLHLAKRGWVLQERLLSPRILHFAKDRIFWECGGIRSLNEALPNGIPGTGEIFDRFAVDPFNCDPHHQPSWTDIREDYSKRALTYPAKDKLVAIAAIAQRFCDVSGDNYYAGHFDGVDMAIDLAWLVIPDPKPSPPTARRSPTWSWTSVDLEVKFQSYQVNHAWAKVEEATVDLVNPLHTYGQVRGGKIDLACFRMCCAFEAPEEVYNSQTRVRLWDTNEHDNSLAGHFIETTLYIRLDEPGGSLPIDLYLVPLAERTADYKPYCSRSAVGIVLSKHEDNTYSRLGAWVTVEGLISRGVLGCVSNELFERLDRCADSELEVLTIV